MSKRKIALLSIIMLGVLCAGCKKGAQADSPKTPEKITRQDSRGASGAVLDRIFSTETLSSSLSNLEKLTGKPLRNFGDMREYKVGACPVTVHTAGEQVAAIEMKLSPSCTFDISRIASVLPENTYVHQLTYGQFDTISNGGGQFYADCLGLGCGNAYDPSVYQYWEGPRADQFVGILLRTELTSDKAMDASSRWEEVMTKKDGDDFVMESRFNCGKYDRQAHEIFRNIPITHIRVGYGMEDYVRKNFTSECK